MRRFLSVLILGCTAASQIFAAIHNVKDYGAKGDGISIDSPAINAAIQAAAGNGGGTVYLPTGVYASYSIRLASHVSLYLEKGATIKAAAPAQGKGYDLAEPFEWGREYQDYGHSHWQNSLIWGIGIEDFTICGDGLIDGTELVPGYGDIAEFQPAPLRGNKAIAIKDCRNVAIRDITMLKCGHFALLATGIDNLTISNVIVDTQRDGFDIDCCRNVTVTGCRLNCPWDDAICLKASYGLGRFKDTEEVCITNCEVNAFLEGTMLSGENIQPHDKQAHSWSPDRVIRPPYKVIGRGRIKFGTESSGGFRNITVSNCVLRSCGGIFLETVDGGILEDVCFSNISIRGTNCPIFFRLGARMRSPEGTPMGKFQRVRLSDINVSDADPRFPILISGIPGYCIEDITLRNINIQFQGGVIPADMQAAGQVPENEDKYPEYRMFGTIPAAGAFLRHVRTANLDGVHFSYIKPDTRPLFVVEDVSRLRLNDITVNGEDVTARCLDIKASTEASEGTAAVTRTSPATESIRTTKVRKDRHSYVDLGLSVKWATCNLGAEKPEDCGDYFAWGETSVKSRYASDNYRWCNGDFWYNPIDTYCAADGRTSLSTGDDAARAAWGPAWRMPTKLEQDELRTECSWTWTDSYKGSGVAGYVVESNKPGYKGKHIFLPAAGDMYESCCQLKGINGFYLSRDLIDGYWHGACSIFFSAQDVDWLYHNRYYGLSIRPVQD